MKSRAVNPGKSSKRHISCLLLACVYGALFCASVYGLDRDRTITQFYHTAWTEKEGAPPGAIKAIAQTTDGYLWLGTPNGLYRFDGVRFEAYVPRSGGDFPAKSVYTLLATPDGGLWIGFMNRYVSFLKDGNLTNYDEAEGLPGGGVVNFAMDSEGSIWAAFPNRGLYRFEGSRWQHIGTEWGYPGKSALTVFVDRAGTLWAATENTITFLPKGARSFQATGEKIGQVIKMVQSPEGGIWMAETTRAVRQLPLPGLESGSLGPEIQVGSQGILFDREGALWVTSVGDGMRRVPFTDRFRGKKIAQFSTDAQIFTEENGLSGNYIHTVFEDREGNIWVGTSLGLDRFRDNAVAPIRFPPGEQSFGIAPGRDGDIWVSSNRGFWGIRRHDDAPTKINVEVPQWGSESIFSDKEGAILVGGYDSIFVFKENRGSVIEPPATLKPSRFAYVWMNFKDADDRLLAYFFPGGLLQFKDGVWERYARESELPKGAPISGAVDSLNRQWFGYTGNLLAVVDSDRIRAFSGDDGVQAGDIKAFYERSGRVWVGGTLGISVFEKDRFRTLAAEDAEVFRGISGIVETLDGSLWLNGLRGIIHIPAAEVRLFLENPDHRVHYRVFDFLDGLPGAPQQTRPVQTAVEGSDGRLWFSTTKGVAWIDPRRIPGNNLPPPVSIRSLLADDKLYEPSPSLGLPEGTTRLQINFTALSLSIPERVRFKYKLEGVDNDWQYPGARRDTTYTNLSPGNYRFRVIASNNDGVWNEEGATLEFSIAPMFYQTLWFRFLIFLLALLLIVGIIILIYRARLARATERLNLGFEERLAERTRIAHDLHDTLLQGFFGASMRLQAVSHFLQGRSDKAKADLDDVLDQIDVVLEEGRRAIWDMNALSLGGNDLGEAFTLVGEDLNKTYPTDFCLTIEGESRPLNPLVRDQIYRIGREALINAYRHARASRIEIEIEYAPKYLSLVIRDNGCGIRPDYLSAGREGHLGLRGMREYAEKIGAELKIRSRAESGTEVELIVPHQIAFVKTSSIGFPKAVKAFIGGRADNEKKQPPN